MGKAHPFLPTLKQGSLCPGHPPLGSSPRAGPGQGDAGQSAQDPQEHRRSWYLAGQGSAPPAPTASTAGSTCPCTLAWSRGRKGCERTAAGGLPPASLTTVPSPGTALPPPAWEVLDDGAVAQPVEEVEVGEAAAGGTGHCQRSIWGHMWLLVLLQSRPSHLRHGLPTLPHDSGIWNGKSTEKAEQEESGDGSLIWVLDS